MRAIDYTYLAEPDLLRPGKRPMGNVKIDWSHALARPTLKAFYIFDNGGSRELVANRQPTLTGNSYYDENSLYVIGGSGSNTALPIGFDYAVEGGITLIIAQRPISGAVGWSLLHASSNWNGIYFQIGAGFYQSNNNDFSGLVNPSGVRLSEDFDIVCVSTAGNNNLKAVQSGGVFVSDTSTTFTSTTRDFVNVGGSLLLARGNWSTISIASLMAFSEEIPDSEKRELVNDMYQFLTVE